MAEAPTPRPASTVVLLRDGPAGLETLLLRRNKALLFAGGFWVFPGGALESADLSEAGDDEVLAARLAAAREAEEETGLRPQLEAMLQLSHWTTPEAEPRRFSTWFFAAPLETDGEVVIDGSEIHDSSWLPVRAALATHRAGELGVLPPTFVTLCDLARFDSLSELRTKRARLACPEVLPVLVEDEGSMAVLFPGDAGYDRADPTAPGARHRCRLRAGHWEYQYLDVRDGCPPLIPELDG